MGETKRLAERITGDVRTNWELYLALFLIHIGLGVAGPVLSEIKSYFQLESTARVSLVFSAFGLARLICDLPGSFLIQKVKHESLMVAGAVLMVIGSVMVTIAPSFDALLAGRVIAGTGSALINISALSLLNLKATTRNRGRVLSLYAGFSLCGTALGPGLGGVVASFIGWRGAFGASAIAAVLALACVAMYLAKSVKSNGENIISQVKTHGPDGADGGSAAPSRSFLGRAMVVNASTFVLLFALEGFNNTIIPLFGSSVLGLGPGILGFTLGFMALARFLVSFFGGILSDRYGRGAILIPCLFIAGISAMVLTLTRTFPVFFIVVVVFALGRMANNINVALLGDVTPREKIGFMIGINRFLADLGLTLGPWAMGMVADQWGFETAGVVVGMASFAMALLIWRVFGRGLSGGR